MVVGLVGPCNSAQPAPSSEAAPQHSPPFRIANTFADRMVLQRGGSTVVFGFDAPGSTITATFNGTVLKSPPVVTGGDGIWRVLLPAAAASKRPVTIGFSSNGATGQHQQPPLELRDVLFGDVFLCSGQSNMQYTPHSMNGMNNLTAEVAAADGYADGVRIFTVGMETQCGAPGGTNCGRKHLNCSTEFVELDDVFTPPGTPCTKGCSCRETWTPASSAALGADAWNTFSAVCWLFGRDIYDGNNGKVPVGLISSNWDGTCVEAWQPNDSVANDGCPDNAAVSGHSTLFNTMIAPFAVGPMALAGVAWYQGECNVGFATEYACRFPSLIRGWRKHFQQPKLWFGFVQIGAYRYSHANWGRRMTSAQAGDLRQAQLAALALDNVGFSTAIDTSDWLNIHPPDKQTVSGRLAFQFRAAAATAAAAAAASAVPTEGVQPPSRSPATRSAIGVGGFPMFAGSSIVEQSLRAVTVHVVVTVDGKPSNLTTDAPAVAVQSTTLGVGCSVPRNRCIAFSCMNASRYKPVPSDCGYPAIIGTVPRTVAGDRAAGLSVSVVSLNATATVHPTNRTLLVLTTATKPPAGFVPTATSYGRGSWPTTVFFGRSADAQARWGDAVLPIIPWFANFSVSNPWSPPLEGW